MCKTSTPNFLRDNQLHHMTIINDPQRNRANPIRFDEHIELDYLFHPSLLEMLVQPCLFGRHKLHLWERYQTTAWFVPPGLPLKIRKGESIPPEAVTVTVSAAHFKLLIDLQMSVQVTLLSELCFPFRENGAGVWSIFRIKSGCMFGSVSVCLASETNLDANSWLSAGPFCESFVPKG